MKQNESADVLLTKKDICRMFQISLSSVERLRRSGGLPEPIKIGGSLRWRPSDIDKILNGKA